VDVLIKQLAAMCREHVTRNKWVFVPSHAIGHTVGERIVLGGTKWLNLRFVTPVDVAPPWARLFSSHTSPVTFPSPNSERPGACQPTRRAFIGNTASRVYHAAFCRERKPQELHPALRSGNGCRDGRLLSGRRLPEAIGL
jgi:hypothetical protein